MSLMLNFIVAFLLSFSGTIPIGLITLTISQQTIAHGKRTGWEIALGATLMEFFYTALALTFLDFFTRHAFLEDYIKLIAVLLFFLLGVYYLMKEAAPNKKVTIKRRGYNVLQGMATGAMNTLIIPFWLFLGVWLASKGMQIDGIFALFIFSFGAAMGALLAFVGYIFLSDLIRYKFQAMQLYTNRVVGCLFIGLSLFQLVELI